jgi:LacI family transcriptional regulator
MEQGGDTGRARRVATLRSVADAAGVHASTVSRALNAATCHLVAADVVDRIRVVAREQGYRANVAAASLRTRRSRLVGVVLPDIANPVFGPILSGIEAELSRGGYSALVVNAISGARQTELVDGLIARRVDGLVLATASTADDVLTHCLASGVPTVLVNRAEVRRRTSAAVSDDVLGLKLAVRHLAALGHRRIGFLGGPAHLSTGLLRRRGYEEGMAEAGLAPGPLAEAAAYSREAGRLAAAELLEAEVPTAVAAANDLLALGLYEELAARGLACPRDVSVTGHNDMPLVDMVSPPLTTVRINQDELGRMAASLLVQRIEVPDRPAVTWVSRPCLVARASTGPPRPGAAPA